MTVIKSTTLGSNIKVPNQSGFELQFAIIKAREPRPESRHLNLCGSETKPVCQLEPKIGFKPDFYRSEPLNNRKIG